PRRAQILDSTSDSGAALRREWLAWLVLPFYMIAFFLWTWRLGRASDIILSHWLMPAGVVGACASWMLGKPHVVVEHSGALRWLARLPGGRHVVRFIVRRSAKVVTVSHELCQQLRQLVPEAEGKVVVISMGVNIAPQPLLGNACSIEEIAPEAIQSTFGREGEREPTDDDALAQTLSALHGERRIVLYLGRLVEVKGVRVLIEAMEGVKNAFLVVAGDGPLRGELESLAARRRVPALFLGQIGEREKRLWLARCRVVAIPSVILENGQTEGLPVVCLEALAAGRPVVASRVGGLPEVIRDGENGLLVEPGDVRQWRAALTRALNDPNFARAAQREAQRTAARYDWRIIGARFARLIDEAITGAGSISVDRVEGHGRDATSPHRLGATW
ncbi:MAG: glycosyltransferase family 4 protein, partial [Acidobacteria bacterium]